MAEPDWEPVGVTLTLNESFERRIGKAGSKVCRILFCFGVFWLDLVCFVLFWCDLFSCVLVWLGVVCFGVFCIVLLWCGWVCFVFVWWW